MQTYIGTKLINAEPMTKLEALERGLVRQGATETAVVDAEGYLVQYEDGYQSWSPSDTFERAYRLVTDAEKALLR